MIRLFFPSQESAYARFLSYFTEEVVSNSLSTSTKVHRRASPASNHAAKGPQETPKNNPGLVVCPRACLIRVSFR
jgi:hypothetical protein